MPGLIGRCWLVRQSDGVFKQNRVNKGKYVAYIRGAENGNILSDEFDVWEPCCPWQGDISTARAQIIRLVALPGKTREGTKSLEVDFLACSRHDPFHSFGGEERDAINGSDIPKTEAGEVKLSKIRTQCMRKLPGWGLRLVLG